MFRFFLIQIHITSSASPRVDISEAARPPRQVDFRMTMALTVSRVYPLTNGNYVVEGAVNQAWVSLLVDGSVRLAGDLPEAGTILGRYGVALGSDNYAFRNELDLIVGDGANRGVHASTTNEVLTGVGVTSEPIPVSDNGSFIFINNEYDIGNLEKRGGRLCLSAAAPISPRAR